jgi:putative tricarboxylic transport membrane protein
VRAPQDLAAGACLLAVSLFALWASADLPAGDLHEMGPGMLPRGTAALIGLAGVGLVVAACVKRGEGLQRWSWRGPIYVTLSVLTFALTIRTVGLLVAGPLVAFVSGLASSETRTKELLVFAIVITLFSIGLFRYVLHLPIPVLVIPGVVVI